MTGLSAKLTLVLALGAGLSVAALYYVQPMLGVVGHDLGASDREVGLLPTATQVGYALGLLLLAPLGDRFDRRRIILWKAAALVVALVVAAAAPSVAVLGAASLAIGLTASMVQDIIPAAATLAPEARRGRAVGTVMTGLLLGILLSRVASGVVSEQLGWRAVFAGAAVSVAAIGAVLAVWLPRFEPTTTLSYGALLASLGKLALRYRELRRAAIAQALLSAGFSAFWSTLALMLRDEPFHLGSSVAGSFGLAGAAGALIAPVAGRVADRRGSAIVTRLGAATAAIAFAAMLAAPLASATGQLVVLAAATVVFDLGVQASLIAHQAIIYQLEPAARSRLNAVLVSSMFVGMAIGAGAGSLLLDAAGWPGVVGFALAMSLGALVVRLR